MSEFFLIPAHPVMLNKRPLNGLLLLQGLFTYGKQAIVSQEMVQDETWFLQTANRK